KNEELLKAIIEKNEAGNSKVYSRSEDKAVVNKLTKLKYAGEIDCIGGVVIENEDGRVYLDFKYDTILKETSEQSLKQVSDILFG
ncbi:MAG: V-type ATP synthase subunit E family protein, partial [Candidatus Methanoperedens sp.]